MKAMANQEAVFTKIKRTCVKIVYKKPLWKKSGFFMVFTFGIRGKVIYRPCFSKLILQDV